MTRIINLTPHPIMIAGEDGEVIVTFPTSGNTARCKVSTVELAPLSVDGVTIPQSTSVYGEVEGLPEPQDGVLYLVSTLVAQRAAETGRKDVVSPNTGPTAVRVDGLVKAVRSLQSF